MQQKDFDIVVDKICKEMAFNKTVFLRNRYAKHKDYKHGLVYLIRNTYPRIKWKQIGVLFGGRDHSTMMHSYRVAKDALHSKKDYVFIQTYKNLVRVLDMPVDEEKVLLIPEIDTQLKIGLLKLDFYRKFKTIVPKRRDKGYRAYVGIGETTPTTVDDIFLWIKTAIKKYNLQ